MISSQINIMKISKEKNHPNIIHLNPTAKNEIYNKILAIIHI